MANSGYSINIKFKQFIKEFNKTFTYRFKQRIKERKKPPFFSPSNFKFSKETCKISRTQATTHFQNIAQQEHNRIRQPNWKTNPNKKNENPEIRRKTSKLPQSRLGLLSSLWFW